MASQQLQAQALGDPTRYRIFGHLRGADAPVPIADLVELLGFNHNAIRQHLAKLLEAELIVESTEHRTTRGRPRQMYEARDDALDSFAGEIGSYEWLSQRLLDMHESGESAYDVGRRAGMADVSSGQPGVDPIEQLVAALRRGGFDPSRDELAGDVDAITLGRCPFAGAATRSTRVVCELHRGLIDGHLAASDDDGEVAPATLTLADPHAGGCVVSVRLGGSGTSRQ